MDPQGIPTVVCASLDLPSDTPCCGLKQEDRTITSLPVDALFQIAMRLDCPSLLTMRVVRYGLVLLLFYRLDLPRKRPAKRSMRW